MRYYVTTKSEVAERGFPLAPILKSFKTAAECWKWIDNHSQPEHGLGVYTLRGMPVRRES